MMAAALMTTACSSDDDSTSVSPKPADDQTVKSIPYTVTVGQGTTTRATVASDDVTLQFAAGDELYVENKSANVYGRLTLQSGAGAATGATFSGDLYYTGSEPADDLQLTATLVGINDELANVSGNKVMGFDNYPTTICATMAEAVQKYSKLTGSSTYGEKSFTLSQQTAFLKFSITLSGTTAGSDVSVVIKNGSSTIGTGTVTATAGTSSVKADFVLALATGTTIAAGSTMNVGTEEIVYSSAGMTLNSGGVYEYQEEVSGQGFTINGSGKKVLFSQGNLQATTTDLGEHWTWAFAEHQWDYIGNANPSITGTGTVSANGTVEFFCWSTASTCYGITSLEGSIYLGDFIDWGTLSISNGGGYTWRTLTSAEWKHIFDDRTSGATVNGTTNARYAQATINTDGTAVNGMILFPDGCKIKAGSATWGTINGISASVTKCTKAQWTHLEELGCVFLPAAGSRHGPDASLMGEFGVYWSATPSPTYDTHAYLVEFRWNKYLNSTLDYWRDHGRSVRLVREVE